MSKKLCGSMILRLVLLLILTGGLGTVALAQDGEDPGTFVGPLPPEIEETSNPPDSPDGVEELNPVSEAELERIADENPEEPAPALTYTTDNATAANLTIFKKYRRLPRCTTSGCPGGIDHIAAGTGLRNTTSSVIRLRGVRPGSTAVSAFLYFAFLDTPAPPNPLPITFNGAAVNAFLISVAPNPCWGGGNLWAYRAPVLPQINAGINGDYPLSGVPSNLANGQNPWNPVNSTQPLAEGASLVVLYTNPTIPRGTQVQIHHPISTQVAGTVTHTHFLNLPVTTLASTHTRLGADGQVGGGLTNFNFVTNELTSIAAPIGSPFVQIRGNGSVFSGSEDSDWNGTDGEPLNQLWDTHTLDLQNAGFNVGPTTTNYQVRYQFGSDCVIPVAHVLTYR